MVDRTGNPFLLLGVALCLLLSVTSAATTLDLVGQIGGSIEGVAVQGSVAYVTVGPRLFSLQVSPSGSLTQLGSTPPFPRFLTDVAVSGTRAYVSAGHAGIFVVDVSNPAEPVVLGGWDSPGYAEAVAVEGGILYLADGPYGLRVVNVDNAAAPVEIAWAFPQRYAKDVAVSETTAAVASMTAGLLIADVSQPAKPREQGSLMTHGCAFGVDIQGSTVLLADGWGGLVAISISPQGDPVELDTLETPGWAMDVTTTEGLALVADGFMGLRVIDVASPADMDEIGALEFDGHAVKIAVSGDRAFLVDTPSKLRVVDLFDAQNPSQLHFHTAPGWVENVSVSGGYAYLAAGLAGLIVVDVSSPSEPSGVAQVDTQGFADNVAVSGTFAYVTTNHEPQGLEVFDVSDPIHPFSVAFIPNGHGPYRDIHMSGSIAFLPDERGLSAVDVSDPANPFETGWVDLEGVSSRGGTMGVSVQGPIAAVAQAQDGTVLLDVSDPSAPTFLSRFDNGDPWAGNTELEGNLVYIADLGLRILDIADPENPVQLSFLPSPEGNGRDVVLDGSTVFMTHGTDGVLVFDVSDPADPEEIARLNTLGSAEKAVFSDELLYVADRNGGLVILEEVAAKATDDRGAQNTLTQTFSQGGGNLDLGSLQGHRISPQQYFSIRPASGRPRDLRADRRGDQQRDDAAVQDRLARNGAPETKATTCQVTSTADAGTGSLRWCLSQLGSGDTILFDSAVFPPAAPATIAVTSELPYITENGITIDASNAGVILDGQNGPYPGIVIFSDNNTVRGLQIFNFGDIAIALIGDGNVIGGDRSVGAGPVGQGNICSGSFYGIEIYAGSSGNTVAGNLVGTDVTGKLAMGNSGHGIHVAGDHNLIGGFQPGERNVVSNNGEAGISLHFVESVANRVIGNYAGTDIDGEYALGNRYYGVGAEQGPKGNLIQGNLSSGNYGFGIFVGDPGSTYNSVVGNIVGLNASGTAALANEESGVYMGFGPPGFNRLGGSLPAERNIISGNQGAGITVGGDEKYVLGNFVGSDVTGTQAIANEDGVLVGIAGHSFIGGTRTEEGNVIVGSSHWGVRVVLSADNMILGNHIGVGPAGSTALPNAIAVVVHETSKGNFLQANTISSNSAGIRVHAAARDTRLRANRIGVAAADASPMPNQLFGIRIESGPNQVGGRYPGDGNIIAFNNDDGVQVWNDKGTQVVGNTLYANSGLGIDLCAAYDGVNNNCTDLAVVTPNDPDDPDSGANNLQNFPVLSAEEGGWTAHGDLNSIPNSDYTLDFYQTPMCDPTGYGEGQTYLGPHLVTTDANGHVSFSAHLLSPVLAGHFITATATDAEGSTSEFSRCLESVNGPLFADGFESSDTSEWSAVVP